MNAAVAHPVQLAHFGNDVVDLEDVQESLSSERALARLFTRNERSSLPPGGPQRLLQLACLWAAKEAAYKAVKRQRPEIDFDWQAFEAASDLGCVVYSGASASAENRPGLRLPLRIWLNTDRGFAHALCCGPEVGRSYVWLAQSGRQTPREESAAVRRALHRGLRGLCGPGGEFAALAGAELIGGSDTPPEMQSATTQTRVPVSFSHDGRFVAAALPVPASVAEHGEQDDRPLWGGRAMDVVELVL